MERARKCKLRLSEIGHWSVNGKGSETQSIESLLQTLALLATNHSHWNHSNQLQDLVIIFLIKFRLSDVQSGAFLLLSHRLVKALMWHALREIIKQTTHYYKRQLATAALFKRRYNKMEPSRQTHLKSEVGSAGSLKSSFVSDTGLFVIKSSSMYKALLIETMRLIHTRICIGCWIIS